MSNIYCAILKEPSDSTDDYVEQEYPDSHYKLSDTVYLIDSDETARQVAVNLGIRPQRKGERADVGGVVFSLNGSYSGFTSKRLWAWLNSHPAAY